MNTDNNKQYIQKEGDINIENIANTYDYYNTNDLNMDIKKNENIIKKFYDMTDRNTRLQRLVDLIDTHKKLNQFHPHDGKYKISNKLKTNFLNYITKYYGDEINESLSLLLDITSYITFKQFYKSLKKCVKTFLERIGDEPYIMLYIGNEDKSNFWVMQLAFDYILKKFPQKLPFDIVRKFQNAQYIYGNRAYDFIYVNFDDCVYSGEQLSVNIQYEYAKTNPLKSFVIVPYVSENGYTKIKLKFLKLGIPFENLIFNYKVLTIRQVLISKGYDKDYIVSFFNNLITYLNDYDIGPTAGMYDIDYIESTFPIYFDHKIADYISTYPKLYTYGIIYDKDARLYIYNWLIKNCVGTLTECPPKVYKNRQKYIDFNELVNY